MKAKDPKLDELMSLIERSFADKNTSVMLTCVIEDEASGRLHCIRRGQNADYDFLTKSIANAVAPIFNKVASKRSAQAAVEFLNEEVIPDILPTLAKFLYDEYPDVAERETAKSKSTVLRVLKSVTASLEEEVDNMKKEHPEAAELFEELMSTVKEGTAGVEGAFAEDTKSKKKAKVTRIHDDILNRTTDGTTN